MTALLQTIRPAVLTGPVAPRAGGARAGGARAGALALLAALALGIPGGVETAARAIADAYLQVSVFVAATLAVLYVLERAFQADLGEFLERHRTWHVPAGAALGALPGCGGAIVAVTQYTRGKLSFGAVVATLTSTMGDAMFLLLARAPSAAGVVLATAVVAGIVSGYVVDAVHGRRFLRRETTARGAGSRSTAFAGTASAWERVWLALLVPGLALAVLVGLVPGCGPQIVTTSLYLDGAIPLSAQLGNAISNDGDALFPAIAKAPRTAALATLYSAVPAMIVAYGAYALGL